MQNFGWKNFDDSTCIRQNSSDFSTVKVLHYMVFGGARDGTNAKNINDYVDGLSITLGNPRKHVYRHMQLDLVSQVMPVISFLPLCYYSWNSSTCFCR